MPKVVQIFDTVERLTKSVDKLDLITKEIKLESDFINRENKANQDAIHDINSSIAAIHDAINNLSKNVNRLLSEHFSNHPPPKR